MTATRTTPGNRPDREHHVALSRRLQSEAPAALRRPSSTFRAQTMGRLDEPASRGRHAPTPAFLLAAGLVLAVALVGSMLPGTDRPTPPVRHAGVADASATGAAELAPRVPRVARLTGRAERPVSPASLLARPLVDEVTNIARDARILLARFERQVPRRVREVAGRDPDRP